MYSYRLCNEIDDETLRDFSKFVEGIDDGSEVTLHISSYGGDCFMAVGIIDLMRRKRLNTTAIILGIAASSAAIIALSCNKVIMSPLGHLMLHSAWSPSGEVNEGVKAANDAQLAVIHKRCPDINAKELFNGSDTWISAKAAYKLGLIDEIDASYAIAALSCKINDIKGEVMEEVENINVAEQVDQVEEQLVESSNAEVSMLDLIEKLAERVAALEERINAPAPEANAEGEEAEDDEEQKRMEALYARITAPAPVSAKAEQPKRVVYKVNANFKDYINRI